MSIAPLDRITTRSHPPQQHPNILGAIAALHSLRASWTWLGDMLEPGTPVVGGRHLSPAVRANRNRLARAEKADLAATLRRGLYPTGTGTVPLRLAVLDAQIAALAAVTEAAWLAASTLRARPMLGYSEPWGDDDRRFTAACDYLGVSLRQVGTDLAGTIGTNLDAADRIAQSATNTRPAERDLVANCPACGGRFLVVRTYGTDDATVSCTRCRCHGLDCLCRRSSRTPGLRHIWPASEFPQLNRLLSRAAA